MGGIMLLGFVAVNQVNGKSMVMASGLAATQCLRAKDIPGVTSVAP
jgi:hypothetical protein